MSDELSNASDVRLLERIVARDAAAVRAIYDRHSGRLFGVIMRILRNRTDAEEVLQEVFLRVWTRAEMYDERAGAPAPWLVRLARNRAIDILRSRRARGLVAPVADVHDSSAVAPATSSATPELVAANAERRETLNAALAGLPEEQRALVAAAFFQGYTHSELAQRFGLPLGTVKTRIRTAMMAMRQRLEQTT